VKKMSGDEGDMKLLAVAIAAVLLEGAAGDSIEPSIGRGGGSQWSIDHRRMSIGKRPLLGLKSRRSSKR
tara:strand:+ start:3923 stop:4129 length:207 start_codon:yes stop_codon:yes gene_type:complete